MKTQKTNWSTPDRAAFLIDRAIVPGYVPRCYAEAAQLMSMLAAFLQQQNLTGDSDGGRK